jgi:hypothetical protein
MNEENLSPETLKKMVIKGSVENGDSDTNGIFGSNPDVDYVFMEAESRHHYTQPTHSAKNDTDTTRIIFLPVKDLSSKTKEKLKLTSNQSESSQAICWSFKTGNMEKPGHPYREATLRGAAIMTEEDALSFKETLIKDPRILFSLSRAINNGPVRSKNNNIPVEIQTGKAITIHPNKPDATPIKTNPFPKGFMPNPII